MLARRSDAISPTAHYTAEVWARNDLSHPAFTTAGGRVLYEATRPAMAASRLLGGPTLEAFLVARHRVIDHLLEQAIARGEVAQVVEIAAGLSPRGWRFAGEGSAGVTYVETDLPAMAERKRRALARAGATHRVAALDAFADSGPASLAELAATLQPEGGVAVVTEGLLSYFDREQVLGLWRRLADAFAGRLLCLSDLHVRSASSGPMVQAFTALLKAFVRGRVHLHFADEAEAESALRSAGFDRALLHRPGEFALPGCDAAAAQLVRVIEARA